MEQDKYNMSRCGQGGKKVKNYIENLQEDFFPN